MSGFSEFFYKVIAPLFTRRMIAFYVGAILLFTRPDISSAIVILSSLILGGSVSDKIMETISLKKKEVEKTSTSSETPPADSQS